MDDLIKILKELHPEVDFESCTNLIDDKILDSFDIVTVISEINEEFDVVIPAEEIVPENFNSAKALYALIKKIEDEGTWGKLWKICIGDRTGIDKVPEPPAIGA